MLGITSIVPIVKGAFDLRQFVNELMKFRQELDYDKEFIKTSCEIVYNDGNVNQFVYSLNTLMIYSGVPCEMQTNVYEINNIYNDSKKVPVTISCDELENTFLSKETATSEEKLEETTDENILEVFEKKFEEIIQMIKHIPSDKLDSALNILIKKTYFIDMRIRNRLYKEVKDVQEHVDSLKTNQQEISEKESLRKTVQIFLDKK